MDLVLLIISIVFACSKEEHNYTAIVVLASIGLILSFILAFAYNMFMFISAIVYVIILIICGCATNKR